MEAREDRVSNSRESRGAEFQSLGSKKVDLSSSIGDNEEYLECGDPWDLTF